MTNRTKRVRMMVLLCLVTGWAGAQQGREDALVLYQQGQYARAIAVCLQELQVLDAATRSRERMDSWSVLGWSYIASGQYSQALNSARRARLEVRFDVRIIEIEAEAQFYLGQNLEALSLLEDYVSLAPRGDRINVVYYFMGEIFLRLSEFRHADIAFSTALYHSPGNARWWSRLGYAREQLGNTQEAEEAYNRALELQPSLQEARAGLERIRVSG